MEFEAVRYEKSGGVARITLDSPATLNAMGLVLSTDLRRALDDARDDHAIRVVAITGAGRAFCAGGDVGTFHAHLESGPGSLREILYQVHGAIACIAQMDKPVVAGVNGVAAGAGMALALAVDMAIAAENATFVMAYTGIGASPDGSSTYFLPRVVGTRKAMELALRNTPLDAGEALSLGVVNEVVPDDQLADALDGLAAKLASGPTRAFARTRKLIRDSLSTSFAAQLEAEGEAITAMAQTADFREGVSAFVEKRKPTFAGR